MPARRILVSPQGGGPITPVPPYNPATDVTRFSRRSRFMSFSDTIAQRRSWINGGSNAPVTPGSLYDYLVSLQASGSIVGGQHWNQFNATSGMTGIFTGSSFANATITDLSSGPTGLCPGFVGIYINTAGTNSPGPPAAAGILAAQQVVANGGIPALTFAITDPSTGNFGGPGTSWNGNAINTPGSAYYIALMNAVDAQCAAIAQIPGMSLLRMFWEMNQGQDWAWWATNGTAGGTGCPTNAQFVQFYQNVVNRFRANGITNVLHVYDPNTGGGAYAENDPGLGYCPIGGSDMYFSTTQAQVIANLQNPAYAPYYMQRRGGPFLLYEVGCGTATNGFPNGTYNNAIWGSGIQVGASACVGTIIFCQDWALQYQNGAAAYLATTITQGQLPPGIA